MRMKKDKRKYDICCCFNIHCNHENVQPHGCGLIPNNFVSDTKKKELQVIIEASSDNTQKKT